MGMPFPFREAIEHLLAKELLPTSLGSADLAALDAAVRRQSFFSARTTLESYLDETQQIIKSILNPQQDERGVTTGYNPATARTALREHLRRLDYQPAPGEEDTIKDLSSDARLDLLVKTNTELAQGAGSFIQQNGSPDVVDLWPALELVRIAQPREPRDWDTRWNLAAQVSGDAAAYGALGRHGRMAALKASPLWQALGDGAGGYLDTLGNPYPPFAFQSNMWTRELSRDEAIALGLMTDQQVVQAAPLDLQLLFRRAA